MKRNRMLISLALCLLLLTGCLEEEGPAEDGYSAEPAGGRAEGSYMLPHTEGPSPMEEAESPANEPPVGESPAGEAQPQIPAQGNSAQEPHREPESQAQAQSQSESQAEAQEPPAESPAAESAGESPFGTPLGNSQPDINIQWAQSEAAAEAIDAELFEDELLRLINGERAGAGREPLGLEEDMRWAARIRAPEVLDSLSHTRPDDTSYYTAFDEAGFVYAGKWHGENVSSMQFGKGAYDTASAARFMFEQLKSSPGHYTNMLNENFAQIGIGVAVRYDQDGDVRIGSAQMFAGL